MYCFDERTDSKDNDDDDDSIASCFYSGITNSMLNEKDICAFTENLCESNPMGDIGCQSQYYCVSIANCVIVHLDFIIKYGERNAD